jgi:hypothetical protein
LKVLFASVALLATQSITAQADVVSLQFYKDSCQKFLQSETEDQNMYLWWGAGRISKDLQKDPKTANIKVDDAAASQMLRDYCTAHPDALFVDAADAAKAQIAGTPKP